MHQGFMVNAILKERLKVHRDFLRRPKIIGWIIGRAWPNGFLPFAFVFVAFDFAIAQPSN